MILKLPETQSLILKNIFFEFYLQILKHILKNINTLYLNLGFNKYIK
jgi:hypothetical protein